jgi:glyoxylase-like metal-dependent hydrolase (beta-lactamase superfamily II)
MPSSGSRFKIGEFECIALSDGSFPYHPHMFFSNVPQERLEKELQAQGLPTDTITGPYTCVLVSTGKHKVLLDTGAGGMAPSTGELLRNLEQTGTDPSEIDVVILTHAHPDHIGGNVDSEGKPTFPNARYVMWKKEWDFWTSDNPDLSSINLPEEIKAGLFLATVRHCLPPLRKQIDLIEKESDVVTGIRLLPAPGHTPGHAAVAISSGNDAVLHVADTVMHPMHLEHPDWQNVFDLVQDEAAETRRRILDRAAAERLKIMAYHFPFPTLGRVAARKTHGWEWQPSA